MKKSTLFRYSPDS
uniref:Uncharacterized protein ABCB1 n=1 Tax=Homo sapiens TaxID=9606 RepID=A8E2S6_HUMAN|nr:unknown [Homo sapiens]